MRDRAFTATVVLVGALAVLMLVRNVRESTAPLYGPPTVDRDLVMTKVESGALSFKEARFYVREASGTEKASRQDTSAEESEQQCRTLKPSQTMSSSGDLQSDDASTTQGPRDEPRAEESSDEEAAGSGLARRGAARGESS